MVDDINKNAKSHLSTADESGGRSVNGVSLFGNFNNVKRCKGVSIDLVVVAKLGEIEFYSVLEMSKEDRVQIRCKRTHRIMKRGVIINNLFWLTIEDFFDLPIAKDSLLKNTRRNARIAPRSTAISQQRQRVKQTTSLALTCSNG